MTLGFMAVNKHPARGVGRYLHGRVFGRFARFHDLARKQLSSVVASCAGCLL